MYFRDLVRNIHLFPKTHKNDVETFLTKCVPIVENKLITLLSIFRNIKFQLSIKVGLVKYNSTTNSYFNAYPFFTSTLVNVYNKYNITAKIQDSNRLILKSFDNFINLGSGWTLDKIIRLDIRVFKFKPLRGGNGVKNQLPKILKNKRAIINIPCKDNKCFLYAIASLIAPQKLNRHYFKQYDNVLKNFKLDNIRLPMALADIPKFERQNSININVFGFDSSPYCLYISALRNIQIVNLLLYKKHFYPITNFSRFMSGFCRKSQTKSFYCYYCLTKHSSEENLKIHSKWCYKKMQKVTLPKQGTKLAFTNFSRIIPSYWTIYCDIETIQQPVKTNKYDSERRLFTYEHVPVSFGLYRVCSVNHKFDSKLITYSGPDCERKIAELLNHQCVEIDYIMEQTYFPITPDGRVDKMFRDATHCYSCKKPFNYERKKYIDHCHIQSGFNVRGIACNACNLTHLKTNENIFVVAHAGSKFDFKIILKSLVKYLDKNQVRVLPKSGEKFQSMRFGKLVFIDSFQFLNISLANLAQIQRKGEGSNSFRHTIKHFGNVDLDLILRKSVFPYEKLQEYDYLNIETLPSLSDFYSSLTGESISQEDYKHAELIWKKFKCANLKDYLTVYLSIDILLLADIFEQFRIWGQNLYGLDPIHYVSLPSYAWDAMLRKTGIELELINDVNILNMIEQSIRGGICQVSHRFLRANNRYMEDYQEEEPESYIVTFDANSIYPHSLKQHLPYRDFAWLKKEEIDIGSILTTPDDSPIGYILEVDFNYNKSLHDKHKYFPLAPETIKICKNNLSQYSQDMLDKYQISASLGVEKLLTTLNDKSHYVVHYSLLKTYVDLGLVVTKVHRVLKFAQKPWMNDFIEFNVQQRAQATSDFFALMIKLFMNSIYGKCLQNPRKYRNIQIVNDKKKLEKLIADPRFTGLKFLDDNIVAVESRKKEIFIDKPFYIGYCVLDLSKKLMYEWYYNFFMKTFGKHFDICLSYVDTDSYTIKISIKQNSPDLFDYFNSKKHLFDTSNFPPTHYLYSAENKRKTGFFKLEYGSKIICEFVGLRSKMYSILFDEDKAIQKAKGIPKHGLKHIKHADYICSLVNNCVINTSFSSILSKNQNLFTVKCEKTGLCPFDDKRYILPDGIESLPYGHYKTKLKKRHHSEFRDNIVCD